MSTLTAIQKTLEAQKEGNSVKLSPNSADTSLTASREEGVLIEASNATVGNAEDAGAITIRGGEPHRASIDGGDITIQGGHQPITTSAHQGGDVNILGGDGYLGGSILIAGGDNTNTNASSITGTIAIQTGGENLTSDQHTGNILINTGNVSADDKNSGALDIKTGTPHTHTGSSSGIITIETGGTANTASAGHSGNLFLKTGQSGTDNSGYISLETGDTSSNNSGGFYAQTGATTSGDSGIVTLFSGNTSSGTSGAISIYSGQGSTTSGALDLYTGDSTNGSSGEVSLKSGDGGSALGDRSGSILIKTGDSYSQPGRVLLQTGAPSGGGTGAHIQALTGNITDSSNVSQGGVIFFATGSHAGSGSSGSWTVATGNNTGTGDSGKVDIYTGSSTNEDSGPIEIKTGFTPADGFTSGDITIVTGGKEDGAGVPITATASDLANSGDIMIRTGNTYDVASGDITLKTGDTETTTGNGEINIFTGDRRDEQRGGDIHIEAGDAYPETYTATGDATLFANSVFIKAGSHKGSLTSDTAFRGGLVEIYGGDASQVILSAGSQWKGGDVRIRGGQGSNGFASGEDGEQGDILLTGHNIVINGNTSGGSTNDDGEIEINTYGGVLDINTLGGDVDIDTSGGNLDIDTSGGDFDINAGAGEIKFSSNSVASGTSHNQRILGIQADGVLKALGIKLIGTGTQSVVISANSFINDIAILITANTISANTKIIWHLAQDQSNLNITETHRLYTNHNLYTLNGGQTVNGVNYDQIILYGSLTNNNNSGVDLKIHYILYETI